MRHCFDVHVALDIGEADLADAMVAVESRLAESRDGLVLLQADLDGRGDVSVTVEEAWPVGDKGSTQPLVDAMEADPELMGQLRQRRADPLSEAMARIEEARAALDRYLADVGGA